MNPKTMLFRRMTLAGWLGLVLLMAAWPLAFDPPTAIHPALAAAIGVVPLLFAARGVLRGHAYTHAWLSMLALAYFAHGAVEMMGNPAARRLALAELLLSLCLFFGAMLFTRFRSRELRDKGD